MVIKLIKRVMGGVFLEMKLTVRCTRQSHRLVSTVENKFKKNVCPWILSKGSDLPRKKSLHLELTKFNQEELHCVENT